MHDTGFTQLSLVRQLTFCAGHRLYRHESKCAFFHGHNYRVDIEVVARTELELPDERQVRGGRVVHEGDRARDGSLVLGPG